MELAIATHTAPLAWQAALDDDPRLISTAVTALNEQTRRRAAAARRRR